MEDYAETLRTANVAPNDLGNELLDLSELAHATLDVLDEVNRDAGGSMILPGPGTVIGGVLGGVAGGMGGNATSDGLQHNFTGVIEDAGDLVQGRIEAVRGFFG